MSGFAPIYFASDFHLGAPNREVSLEREKQVVRWLNQVAQDAGEIFLVGDVFDFWFEYRKAVPRGFVRLLGTLAELTDGGLPIHYFTGNHDMWVFDYIPSETGMQLHRKPIQREFAGKRFYIGHGDGLGPGDHGYKFIKKVFANPICQWLFARLHPNLGIGLADYFSRTSRAANLEQDEIFLGEENEWLVLYSKEILQSEFFHYFVFGHRHLPLDIQVGENSRYLNLGEWFEAKSYGVFDGQDMRLERFTG